MQKVFEEIIEKFERVGNLQSANYSNPYISVKGAIAIIEQVAKEYDKYQIKGVE